VNSPVLENLDKTSIWQWIKLDPCPDTIQIIHNSNNLPFKHHLILKAIQHLVHLKDEWDHRRIFQVQCGLDLVMEASLEMVPLAVQDRFLDKLGLHQHMSLMGLVMVLHRRHLDHNINRFQARTVKMGIRRRRKRRNLGCFSREYNIA
jgi:hypothetical protein